VTTIERAIAAAAPLVQRPRQDLGDLGGVAAGRQLAAGWPGRWFCL